MVTIAAPARAAEVDEAEAEEEERLKLRRKKCQVTQEMLLKILPR